MISGTEGELEKLVHAMNYWWQQPLVVRAAVIELVEELRRITVTPETVREARRNIIETGSD